MNTTPTKRSRRHGDNVEHRRPHPLTASNVVAATVDLTGISTSDDDDDDDESDNENHHDCKPKAKKKEYLKVATTATENASLIDLTIHSPTTCTSQPTKTVTTTTIYESDDDTDDDDDDDDVVLVVDPTSNVESSSTTTAITTLAATTTTNNNATTRHHSNYSSPRQRRRRQSSGDTASLALARQLQEQESMTLQQQQQEQKRRDEQQALRLQKEFDAQDKEQKRLLHVKRLQEEEQMSTSVTGRAWKFVEKVLALDASIKRKYHHTTTTTAAGVNNTNNEVSAIAKDDMVFLCEQMLCQQEAFRIAGKPITVDLGFHYTRPDNLSRIRTDGLLSKAEREGRNINSAHHGSAYGDGIYTSNDHSLGGSSGCYGDIGILVARLKGTVKLNSCAFSGNHDCNQNSTGAVTVLKTSAQCLALVEFHRSVLFPTTTAAATTAHAAAHAAAVSAAHATAVSTATQAVLSASTTTLPAALQALQALQAATAASAAALAHPTTLLTVPAVNSGIIGEYHRELQKIVDETFNK